MKLRILQINNFHFRKGGADVVYLNTCSLLRQKKHDVFCFSTINNKNVKIGENEFFIEKKNLFNSTIIQKIFQYPGFVFSNKTRKKLDLLLKKVKPDIAHIHNYKGYLSNSIFSVLKSNNIPVVFTAHDFGLVDPHNLLLNGRGDISESTINKSSFFSVLEKSNRNSYLYSFLSYLEYNFNRTFFSFEKYIDSVICVSKFSKIIFEKCKKFKINPTHIYNFQPNLNKIIPNHNKGDYLLFFGRLSKEKGIQTLINAWNNKKKNSHKLKIVGSGDVQIPIQSGVEYLGFKSGNELNEIIKNASFVVVPSEWYENNPLTIIESFSHGKPVIGSRVGGIPELIENKKNGFIFEMKNYNELSTIIDSVVEMSQDEYHFMSLSARQSALKYFSPENHYKKLIKIYYKLVNSKVIK